MAAMAVFPAPEQPVIWTAPIGVYRRPAVMAAANEFVIPGGHTGPSCSQAPAGLASPAQMPVRLRSLGPLVPWSTATPWSCVPLVLSCENFLYGFKGASSAPRLAARDRARDPAGELAHTAGSGRDAPAGTRRTMRRPLALVRKPTAAAAEARTPAQLVAPAERRNPPRVREHSHPLGAAIVEAEQDHHQGRLCS
jgi:hypothetical protein